MCAYCFDREIVDESDVYVDVHKAIRRLTPAPKARRIQAEAAAAVAAAKKTTEHPVLVDIAKDSEGNTIQVGSLGAQSDTAGDGERQPKTAIFLKRRSSAGPDGRIDDPPVRVKASLNEMRQQLRLGPANRATRPLHHRNPGTFKTKAGLGATHLNASGEGLPPRPASAAGDRSDAQNGNETTPLLGKKPGDEDGQSKANGTR